jgi:hypothetical protein
MKTIFPGETVCVYPRGWERILVCPPTLLEDWKKVGLRMRFMFAAVMVTLSLALVMDSTNMAGEKKMEIKEVMKKAMASKLCEKCASGQASADEKKQLVELFTALAANPAPKGDAKSWKDKTTALVDAAKKVAANDADGGKALKAAANCMACHKEFKGK